MNIVFLFLFLGGLAFGRRPRGQAAWVLEPKKKKEKNQTLISYFVGDRLKVEWVGRLRGARAVAIAGVLCVLRARMPLRYSSGRAALTIE